MAGPVELTGENPALAEQARILARPITPERRMADATDGLSNSIIAATEVTAFDIE